MISRYFLITTLLFSLFSFYCIGQNKHLRLWYDKPARQWEETLPLGNGRLGMTPDGGVMNEKIVLNDITLWSGAPQDANNYEASQYLPQIRELLLNGKNDEAQALIDKNFICKGEGSGGTNYGCFQILGNLELQFNNPGTNDVKYSNYRRQLSLNDAVASCTYNVNGTIFKREYFSSFSDDINIIRITASKPGQINCTISLNRPERFISKTEDKELQMYGQLDNGINGKGMQYLIRVVPKLQDGKLNLNQQTLVVENASELILYISAGTDFKNPSYKEIIQQALNTATETPYALLRKQHITGYRKLFDRVTLDLGTGEANQWSTDKRLQSFYKNPEADNALAVLFFQFGRYLSISSTRVGLLPPNLQGLWANQIKTPWNGDYHLDVNVQMNHWPLEVANLSELNLPLTDLIKGMVQPGEKTAKAYYNANGWVAHVITNIWGFTEPGESASWGITKVGSGWLCNNLWEHYAFTNDTNYLRSIYPILKGAAQFYHSMLILDPKSGKMVTAPSSSPENWFYMPSCKTASICMGPTIDNQIIRELFNNVITASDQLGTDKNFSNLLSETLRNIPPAGVIAPDGRLMEWMDDYKEPDPQHRHISHLYGLYPASLITPDYTPELAEACKKSLNTRGDDGPSWSIAYKQLFWARLHDGNRAYKLFTEIMKPTLATNINYGAGGGVYPNLLSAGPPFQIDGNFGATAGIAEMLLQSHAGYIHLLPALPDAWKSSGEVKGLKARGNFIVDIKWKNGKVSHYRVISSQPRKIKVKVNGRIEETTAGKYEI
jgi:alpha-L-fucosidase 2